VKLFTTSINYADLLAVTLPAWKEFGEVIVITSFTDQDTHTVCNTNGVAYVPTDQWQVGGLGVNKGAAMNDVIPKYLMPDEVTAVFDADCYPVGTIPNIVDSDHVYGCRRYICRTAEELRQARSISGCQWTRFMCFILDDTVSTGKVA
jgi:hypothetical protein